MPAPTSHCLFMYLRITSANYTVSINCYFFTVDIVGVGFEQRVYFTTESAGSVSVCAITNVTLNGTDIITIVLETEDVTAQG